MFQHCMVAIFSDLVEDIMEIFMDDFLGFGGFFLPSPYKSGTSLSKMPREESCIELGEIPFHGLRGHSTRSSYFFRGT